MFFKRGKTKKGFDIIEFSDTYGQQCSMQISSIATDDRIWFGVDVALSLENPRMHLNRSQAKEIAKELNYFAEHGSLDAWQNISELALTEFLGYENVFKFVEHGIQTVINKTGCDNVDVTIFIPLSSKSKFLEEIRKTMSPSMIAQAEENGGILPFSMYGATLKFIDAEKPIFAMRCEDEK